MASLAAVRIDFVRCLPTTASVPAASRLQLSKVRDVARDAAPEERAVAEPRLEVDVEALIQVRLAPEVLGEADQAVGREVEREHRRLEVLDAADLVAAAIRAGLDRSAR